MTAGGRGRGREESRGLCSRVPSGSQRVCFCRHDEVACLRSEKYGSTVGRHRDSRHALIV
eukprot:10972708-Heterocapsa_arctica.AAC.1